MRLLLDTHIWLWWRFDPKKLGVGAKRLLEDSRQQVLVSAVSGIELALKSGLDRIRLTEPLSSYMPRALGEDGFEILPVGLDHALRLSELPARHGDPFDRLLVAQAQVEGLTLMTADAEITGYAVETIWAGRRAIARRKAKSGRTKQAAGKSGVKRKQAKGKKRRAR